MFADLQMAPPDPILGLTEAFKEDPNPNKINLGVGVYRDESGATPIFATVKKAEKILLKQETTKDYLPMPGSPAYAKAVQSLVFGEGGEIASSGRAATAQTPGGSAALRVAGDFIRKTWPAATVWVSNPTWPNHLGIFGAAGLKVATYPYYDAAKKGLDFGKMLAAIEGIPEGDVVLLHGCCHNPTGVDLSGEQWEKVAAAVQERRLLPLIDFAYQGLAHGIEEDATGVRTMCGPGAEALVCSSFSKNFGLYNERVGALTVVGATPGAAQTAFSHVKIAIRQNYSNPPSHGGAIVATILADSVLRAKWEREVAAIRNRIRKMRRLFVTTLKAKGAKADFSFIKRQNGMFSYSGLTKEQVEALRSKYSLYVIGNGRINVAGMTTANMDRLCEAIASVL